MIIDSVHVRNLRSILDETLKFEQLTALVGRKHGCQVYTLHSWKA
jgi:predicted ATP-dependent endonuclease of OLD family